MATQLHLSPAKSVLSKHSFDVSTVASLDFGELLVSRCFEVLESDNFTKIKSKNSILRIAPSQFPAYGKNYVKSAAFFVPEHQIWDASPAFHSNQNMYKGKAVVLPHLFNYDINSLFADFHGSDRSGIGPSLVWADFVSSTTDPLTNHPAVRDSYDFCQIGDDPNQPGQTIYKYYKLNYKGRRFYKLFKSLGYDFCSYTYDTYSDSKADTLIQLSALPLLSFVKVYTDYFLNGQQFNNSVIVQFLESVKHNETFSWSGQTLYNSATGLITVYGLDLVISGNLVPHANDMFTEAWASPNSPDGVSPSSTMVSDNPSSVISPYILQSSSVADTVLSSSLNVSLKNSQGSDLAYINQFGLNILNAFYKFVMRNNLAGSKSVQRLFARFGVKSDDFNTHFVHKLYESSERVDYTAIMSNADTVNGGSGQYVGDYSGFGLARPQFDFDYKSSAFGFILCLNWLQVVPMYLNGFDASVLRRQPFDWYTPEYDGSTVRAIPICEFGTNKSCNCANYSDKSPFGFTRLYQEYREMKDVVLGDFSVGRTKNFLFARDSSLLREKSSAVMLNPQSNMIQYYDEENNADMTDPFFMDATNGDRFYLQIDWEIEAERPVSSTSLAFDLNGTGDLSVPMNGKMIS